MKQTSFLRLQKNIGMTRITSHVIDYIETMGQKKIIQTKILHGEVFTILTFNLSTGSKSLHSKSAWPRNPCETFFLLPFIMFAKHKF